MGAAKQNTMLDVGATGPDVYLKDLNGRPKRLKELLQSGPVLLAFFKVSCPVCRFTFPFLDRIYRGLNGKPLQMFGVSQDDATAAREFSRSCGITFPALLDREDDGYPASNAFGISHVPSLFLIAPDMKISWAAEGFAKKELEKLGSKFDVKPFRPNEDVPEWKGG